ncbi:uncharacterized protein LOC130418751 [Triplophysa dalaica]|uniref:uncharacterized protein LOC130418751 n=1 Tax=Triplophysa dalaica TaxID=1582913 RepID=UPI0024E022E4|nr:uncharacterized protein LOC130418751 [Triplophysa dalaica]
MIWRCLSVLCILLMCMPFESSSFPLGQRGSLTFSHSLHLTRTVRSRVQKLLTQYKQQMFGDELFEYREIMLSTLPAVTVSYQIWLQMQDINRLQLAYHHLQTFWTHLEDQRQLLEKEKEENRRELRRDKRGRPQATLCQRFMALQIDMRDLIRQVNSQLESLIPNQDAHSTSTKSPLPYSTPTSSRIPTTHRSTASTTLHSSTKLQTPSNTNAPQSSTTQTSTQANTKLSAKTEKTSVGVTVTPKSTKKSTVLRSGESQLSVDRQQRTTLSSGSSRWYQHLKGYVILRDLERFLSRLARDYIVLQAKQT